MILNLSRICSDERWTLGNIHAKRKRIKAGSGETMRTPDLKGLHDEAIARGQKTSKKKSPVSVATVGMLEKRV